MTRTRLLRAGSMTLVLLTLIAVSPAAFAQYDDAYDDSEQQLAAEEPDEGGDTAPSKEEGARPDEPSGQEAAATMTVFARVEHGATGEPVADAPVFLRAARPRGPFEPRAPTPVFESSAFTDSSGSATFNDVPRNLTTRGLRLHAVTTYGGVAFQSSTVAPAQEITLAVKVYEKSTNTDGVTIDHLRTIVEPWEAYLVFTQYYTLTNTAETALDVSLLPDADYENGLPITLPVKAQGIQVNGPGETKVVNSTVYWKGVLRPHEKVRLQARFSMSAKSEEFVYGQTLEYPARSLEIVVPVQTKFRKLPRLDGVTLAAPGFEEVEHGEGLLNLRDDMEFIAAHGASVEAGEQLRFQLRNLPFHRPITPWIFLGLGVLSGGAILLFARRERRRMQTRRGRETMVSNLREEREELLEELVELERDFEDGLVTGREYEVEALSLRERIALVMKKIDDLENEAA